MVCPTPFAEANQIVNFSRAPAEVCGAALQGLIAGISSADSLRCPAEPRLEELIAANRRKDELLATVCHELRSPLTSIRHAARLLGSPAQDAAARASTQALLERQVQHMSTLVDDLLDLSRVANGHSRLQKQRVDLRVVVGHAIESMAGEIAARRHRLSTVLPEGPVWVMADPLRLERVFVNLLANAAKYTDPGGRLSVWMRMRDAQAIVQVRDSGIGIAAPLLPRVFNLFTQANEADPRSASGLGIGLAVVRSHVEQHGGSVTARSQGHGQGSVFTVRLPRDQ